MSNQELDNLFKHKLEKLHKQPSANAWDRIQSQTQSKTSPMIWWRVAAAILLLMVSGIIVWQYVKTTEIQQPAVSEKQPTNELKKNDNSEQLMANIDNDEPKLAEKTEKQSDVKTNTQTSSANRNTGKKIENAQTAESHASEKQSSHQPKEEKPNQVEQLKPVETLENTDLEKNIASMNTPDATIEKQTASSKQQAEEGTTLEFDLEDFKNSALASNETTTNQDLKAEGTEDQSKKGLSKVWDIVKDLKKEANIGELREAKDEIFAFNFKKENKNDSK